MATAATCLVTLDQVRAYVLEDTDTSQDARLELLANSVSDAIERRTGGYVFQARTITSEAYNGPGGNVLTLRSRPVTAVTAVTIDGQAVTVDANSFAFDPNLGMLHYKLGTFTRGVGNVVVTYAVGMTALPQDLVMAALRWIKRLYSERKDGSADATSVSIGSQSIMIRTDLPSDLSEILARWQDVRM